MRGARHLLLGSLAIACGGSDPPVRHVVTVIAPSAPDAATIAQPLVADDAICARVMKEQRAKILDAIEAKRKANDWDDAHTTDTLSGFDRGDIAACHAFPGGAWALEISPSEDGGLLQGDAISTEVSAVIYVHDARIASSQRDHVGASGSWASASTKLASDYDGDGIPEFWVSFYEDGVEGGHSESGALFTFKNGAVVEYAPASSLDHNIGKPLDIDGDGRLDLPTSAGVRLFDEGRCWWPSEWKPAGFVAHALPGGTFSMSDTVAKNAALAWCPKPPTIFKHAIDALCARLWTHTPTEIATTRKRIAICVAWDCNREQAQQPQLPNADIECSVRLNAFDATPPFTLP